MNENELEETIRKLNDPLGANIRQDVLADDFFLDQPEYLALKKAFRESKYRMHGWKWHQLVRVILEPPEIRHYMYERLLNLILKHRRSFMTTLNLGLKMENLRYQIQLQI